MQRKLAITYGLSNCQQAGKFLWDFTFCQFLQLDIWTWANLVLNSFHFYTRWNKDELGKSSGLLLKLISPEYRTSDKRPYFYIWNFRQKVMFLYIELQTESHISVYGLSDKKPYFYICDFRHKALCLCIEHQTKKAIFLYRTTDKKPYFYV